VTVTLDGKAIKLVIGDRTLSANGQTKQMDVTPVIKDGRTYLPARWVAEAFGYTVRWNPQVQTVYIGQPVEIGAYPFPAKLIRLEMEVGSNQAVGTMPDGTIVDIMLPEAPYKVVQKKEYLPIWPQDFKPNGSYSLIFKKYPMAIDPEVKGGAVYIPFVAVAEAFGVPSQNMVWDGGKLKVWWNKDEYDSFTPDSKILVSGNIKDNWSRSTELDAPIRVKNGVVMIGETAGDGIEGVLFTCDGLDMLIKASQNGGDVGDLSGKPIIVCQPY
jgi:hypothetical protein